MRAIALEKFGPDSLAKVSGNEATVGITKFAVVSGPRIGTCAEHSARIPSGICILDGFELEYAPIAAGTHRAVRGGMNCGTGIAREDTIAPEFVLPAQFRDLWHGPRAESPEAILAVSVLGQAANDLQSFRFARRRRFQRLYMEAYEWVASNDRSWPYAFVNLCDALSLSAKSARARLLGDAPAIGAVNADRVATAIPSERVAAPVFRLSRAANLKPMMIMRPSTDRRRSRVSHASKAQPPAGLCLHPRRYG